MKPDEWVDLTEEDGVCGLAYVAPELSCAVAPFGWDEAARWASTHLGGLWMPNTRGLTWICGRKVWRLCEFSALKPLEEARSICVEAGAVPGWSIGGCAKGLLASVTPGRRPPRDELARCPLDNYAYHRARPCYLPWARKIDCTSYYYSLMGLLPSWQPFLPSHGLVQWEYEGGATKDQRMRVHTLVRGHKMLRNAIVGVAVGGSQGRPYYHKGHRSTLRPVPSSWSLLGHLIVRWGYDLCQAAADEVDGVWAHTDGLITADTRDPQVWRNLGLTVRTISAGPCTVNHLLGFRCGLHASAYYDENGRYQEATDSGPIRSPWLKCRAMPGLGAATRPLVDAR